MTLRGIETFLTVLVATLISNIALTGHAIDLSTPAGQGTILTALLSAFGMAARASGLPVVGGNPNGTGSSTGSGS